MNKIVLPFLAMAVSGCVSTPTNRIDERKAEHVLPIEFPTNDAINGQASFSFRLRYDGLRDEAEAKKRKLQEGIVRGIQTIVSIPSFVVTAKTDGSVRFESLTENYRGDTCSPRTLDLIQEEWKDPNADRIQSLCQIEVLRGGYYFASTDAFLENSKLVNATLRESGFYSEAEDSYFKSYPEELMASSGSNPKSPTFEVGTDAVRGRHQGMRRTIDINFHPQKQNYIRKLLFSLGDGMSSANGYIVHSVIGKHKIGEKWTQVIPNIALVKKMRRMIPQISKEQYTELAKRVEDKLQKFDLNYLVQECNQGSVSDICISRSPADYETNVTQKPKLLDLRRHYLQFAKKVTKNYPHDLEKELEFSWASGHSAPVFSKNQIADLREYAHDSTSIDQAESAITDLWGFLLIDSTEIIANRSGDTVEIKFVIDFQKLFASYQFLTM